MEWEYSLKTENRYKRRIKTREIIIEVKHKWCFIFSTENPELSMVELHCYSCKTLLDSHYSYIINRLEKTNLLPDDYKPVCCYCYALEKAGLLGLREEMTGFEYFKGIDIMEMKFQFLKFNKEKKREYVGSDWVQIPFRIHDWSKVREA